ncbi:MAG TPA: ATP-binding protein [Bryobacteraceae bacterium]|jgi:serine/threonine-protein kinase RsbW|nr:ATP-binding protein [Bryobacteraceae bacterium]
MGNNARGETETVDQFLDSTLESVDSAEELAIQVARKAGFEEDDLNKIAMAVRESMVNAVVHGNRYNARKRVHLSVSKEADRLLVKVGDEGEGFDYENLPDPLAEENLLRNSGRGIFLMRAFMDEFAIRRLSPTGIEVTLVKYRAAR